MAAVAAALHSQVAMAEVPTVIAAHLTGWGNDAEIQSSTWAAAHLARAAAAAVIVVAAAAA